MSKLCLKCVRNVRTFKLNPIAVQYYNARISCQFTGLKCVNNEERTISVIVRYPCILTRYYYDFIFTTKLHLAKKHLF